jgi:hypothetical protein
MFQMTLAIAIIACAYYLQRRLMPFVSTEEQQALLRAAARVRNATVPVLPRDSHTAVSMIHEPSLAPTGSRAGRASGRQSISQFAVAAGVSVSTTIETLTDFNVRAEEAAAPMQMSCSLC